MSKRALVTGATSGIGAEFTRTLAREGMDIVLVARDEVRLRAMSREVESLGQKSEVIVADLSTADGVAAVEARLLADEDPIDFLINNAGFGSKGAFIDIDIEQHEKMIEVNVNALVRLTHAAAKAMTARKHGDILNMSSVAAFMPALRPSSTYAATKAFVAALSEGLAPSLAVNGITISAVCPGWVRTEFHARAGITMSKLPGFLWLEPSDVVKAGLRDHRAGKPLSFPGWPYKVVMVGLRIIPTKLQHTISRRVTRSQH